MCVLGIGYIVYAILLEYLLITSDVQKHFHS
jgi:hypothetical protein